VSAGQERNPSNPAKDRITNKECQELCNVKKRQATDDLKVLEGSGVFERVAISGKGTEVKVI